MNGKAALPIRQTLDAIGYPQDTTDFLGDNTVAIGIATDKIQPKRSRYVDAKFHWFRDRVRRKDFSFTWVPSWSNKADPLTKIFSRKEFERTQPFLAQINPSVFTVETNV